MTQISYKLAAKLADSLSQGEKELHIYQYAIQVLFEKWIGLSAAALISIGLGMGKEFLAFLLVFAPLRTFGGGMHMKTYAECFAGSNLLVTGILLGVKYAPAQVNHPVLICISSLMILSGICKMTPVLHANRPMKESEIILCRKRIRQSALVIYATLMIFVIAGHCRLVYLVWETIAAIFITMAIPHIRVCGK